MPIEVPQQILARTRREDEGHRSSRSFEGLAATQEDYLSHARVPQPAGTIVSTSKITTMAQARDYARAGFHACVNGGLSQKNARGQWNEAAKAYFDAHGVANAAALLSSATNVTALKPVIDMLRRADGLADIAKKVGGQSTFPSSSGSFNPPTSQPEIMLPGEIAKKPMGLPLKIAIAGGAGFALLAVFGKSKKDSKGGASLMGALSGNKGRRKKMTRAKRYDRAVKRYKSGRRKSGKAGQIMWRHSFIEEEQSRSNRRKSRKSRR